MQSQQLHGGGQQQQQQPQHDLRASIETIEDGGGGGGPQDFPRPVYPAPSLMSVRSCFVVSSSNGQSQLPYHYAQSQPQLSHSFSQPFISRMSNSADHLVTSSLSQLHAPLNPCPQLDSNPQQQQGQQSNVENGTGLPFHEHVKNSAAYKFHQKKSVTVCSDSSADVNVIGTPVRIQVQILFLTHFWLFFAIF